MALTIYTIHNDPIDSNSYIVYDKDISPNCIIIDPGEKDCFEVERFMDWEKLNPQFIILTHEHFDHCWGCNYLQDKYNISILCSRRCSEAIKNSKLNLSIFFSPNDPFQIFGRTQQVTEGNCIELIGKRVFFYETKGHTSSSISILIENALFTGDTLIKGCKTVTRLPSGSKEELLQSFQLYASFRGRGLHIYPGHGEPFELDEDFSFNS